MLLQPWLPKSHSAPHRLLSPWQQPLAHPQRSSVSCLTTDLTALGRAVSAIPCHTEMTLSHISFYQGQASRETFQALQS